MDITPGTTVTVEIAKAPRSEAARKTLVRLYRHTAEARQQQRRQKNQRPSWQTWRRGGRMWHHQMKTKAPFTPNPGSRFALLATVDAIRDLASVARFVKVTAS